MAKKHYHAAKDKSAGKKPKGKQVCCAICHKADATPRMKREPPQTGPWVHKDECRDEKRRKDEG